MKELEMIILAGGLGTRLKPVISDAPKCMAPVANKPFLSYVLKHFTEQGVTRFIFSLGYMHEKIEEWLKNEIPSSRYTCSIEIEPLGTGGALKKACTFTTTKNPLVTNGDTLFKIDVNQLVHTHETYDADCTLSLKKMYDFDRFGTVEITNDTAVSNFIEKKKTREGYINGGVYALNTKKFLDEILPEKFSFESDYLQMKTDNKNIRAVVQDAYFIDIGVPEDYARAQNELI